MFYLNTIEQLFLLVEQLDQIEVCLPYSRHLAGILILAVFQNLRWNSNKTSLGRTSQPSGSNLMELEWDEELSWLAQAHADTCQWGHDCSTCRRLPRWRNVGQNLYQSHRFCIQYSFNGQGLFLDWHTYCKCLLIPIPYFCIKIWVQM